MTSSASLTRPEQSLRSLAEHGALLATAPGYALGQPVPAAAGTVEDVLRHVARGDRWITHGGEQLPGARADATADTPLALTTWEPLLTVWRRKPLHTAAARGEIPIARGIDDHIRL